LAACHPGAVLRRAVGPVLFSVVWLQASDVSALGDDWLHAATPAGQEKYCNEGAGLKQLPTAMRCLSIRNTGTLT
jgi:hypothetical protein